APWPRNAPAAAPGPCHTRRATRPAKAAAGRCAAAAWHASLLRRLRTIGRGRLFPALLRLALRLGGGGARFGHAQCAGGGGAGVDLHPFLLLVVGRKPAPAEAGPFQAGADVRALLHHRPHEFVPVVGDHGQDRPLVDADVVAGHPALAGDDASGLERDVVVEAGIERVQEAVAGVQVVAVAAVHLLGGRDHHLRREHDRGDRRGRDDGAVVEVLAQAGTARGVVAELALLAVVDLAGVLRAVAGGQAPDVLAVVLPLHRVGDGVLALGQRGAAAVEEVVAPALAHVLVLDVAEVDPDVAVLVAEQRTEAQVLLSVVHAPVVVVGAGPHRPGLRLDRV